MIELLIYPLVGILSGFLAGFFGVGGGIVLVPALHFLYTQMGYSDEISIPIALGTALACIVINSLSAIPVHHRNKNISWTNFYKLFAGIAFGAILGAFISVGAEKELFKKIFAFFILLVSLRMFFKMQNKDSFVDIPIIQAVPLLCIVIFSSFSSRFGAYMTQKVNEKVFQTLYALQLVPIFLYWFFA